MFVPNFDFKGLLLFVVPKFWFPFLNKIVDRGKLSMSKKIFLNEIEKNNNKIWLDFNYRFCEDSEMRKQQKCSQKFVSDI
jgi:hypothetical protein